MFFSGVDLVESLTGAIFDFGIFFKDAAKRALHELWRRRTKIGLVGNTINMTSGEVRRRTHNSCR